MAPPTAEIERALAQLRQRLLDLSARNRLLNFKHTAGRSLQFVEGQPSALCNRLIGSSNQPVAITGVPEPPRQEWIERNGRLVRPDARDWARKKGIRTTYDLLNAGPDANGAAVRALFYADDLAKHCRKIEREAKSAIEETGANMLFLVLGFMEFPEYPTSVRSFLAPLVTIPVALTKRVADGREVFSFRYTGEELTQNISLREKLGSDYSLVLPEFEGDQSDIESFFTELQRLLKPHPGFALRRWASLCILSFTNMLLMRDLDPDNWQANGQNVLLDHPIIREVFAGRSEKSQGAFGDTPEHDVEELSAAKIPLVFDADSSQHSALIDVLLHRKNLVIEGPPGTGKSQTIANLLAAGLAEGKRILFVAEKLEALRVVKRRLEGAGLAPFVFELHSTKTTKKGLLEELAKRIKFQISPPTDLPKKLHELEVRRTELNAYRVLINSVSHNSFGLTLQQTIGRSENHRRILSMDETQLSGISIPDATQISAAELSRRTSGLGHLAKQYLEIGGFDKDCTWWGFFPRPLLPADEFSLKEIFADAQEWAASLLGSVRVFKELCDGDAGGLGPEIVLTQLEQLNELTNAGFSARSLSQVSRLLGSDSTGKRTQKLLEALSVRLKRYDALSEAVQQGLRAEISVEEARLARLQGLERIGRQIGAHLGTPADLEALAEEVGREAARLALAARQIQQFCQSKGIPFDGSRQALHHIERLTRLIMEGPDEALRLQQGGLSREGCQESLADLADVHRECIGLHAELNRFLSLDRVPSEGEVHRAIAALREHRGWTRILRSDWRAAVATHKRIHREKRRLSSDIRLSHLERVARFLRVRERWERHPAWTDCLRISPDPDAPLAEYIELVQWNESVRELLKGLPAALCSPELTRDEVRALRRELGTTMAALSTAVSGLAAIDRLLPRLGELRGEQTVERAGQVASSFATALKTQLDCLRSASAFGTDLAGCLRSCEAAVERGKLKAAIEGDQEVKALLGDHFAGVATDVESALEAVAFGQKVDELPLPAAIRTKLKLNNPLQTADNVRGTLEALKGGFANFARLSKQLGEFGEFSLEDWVGCVPKSGIVGFSIALRRKLGAALADSDKLIAWSMYVARRHETQELGLSSFVRLLEEGRIPAKDLAEAYAYCVYANILQSAFRAHPELGKFSGLKHNQIREEFQRLDREIIQSRGQAIAAQSVRNALLPPGSNGPRVDDKTEMILLNYLIPQQKPRMRIRKMITNAGRAVQALQPCFMMGPQAVAQFLSPRDLQFDLVVMDEASQLKPEHAVGAVARGAQLVVVGDSKQLPPTSFFSRIGQAQDDDDQFVTTEAESILDVCAAHFHPPRPLRWHYRSQHHSLITFSDHRFYGGRLIVFPSPYGPGSGLGVRATYLADAVYENQTNLREATRVVDAVVQHLGERAAESLGVVTLNIKQRDLIADLLEERLRNVSGAESFKDRWASEGFPLFVKNLENVQGDERDAIIVSTTFGKPPGSGAVRQNFGPISRQDGWRRLNVLVTRARKSVAIYTSLRPEDIVIDNTTPDGTRALRDYLEYARTGSIPTPINGAGEPESEFELAVMSALQARGYQVTPQLGVAGFRIDLAVKHPDAAGIYLAAIECDGASYHSSKSVRDRDRIRQEVLESLGWRGRIWRIWSTDWFRGPRKELERLVSFLEDIRRNWKSEHVSGESWVEEGCARGGEQPAMEPNLDRPASSSGGADKAPPVREVSVQTEDELEVQVGDLVKYADLERLDDILSVRIVRGPSDIENGIISETKPLAQALLGAAVGDEVGLHLPGTRNRVFRILAIKRFAS